MAAHLTHMSRWIQAYLVPGSTGDGWEMNEDEVRQVVAFDINMVKNFNTQILIGVLRTDAEIARQSIVNILAWLKERTGVQNNEDIIEKTGFCGFAVCAPHGSNLSQKQIYDALVPILRFEVPIALYQLPQATENEISPETIARLAEEFGNFYLFKDSSGYDRVALSGLELNGVYLLRGAEGGHSKWLRTNGGIYDGFLLGSANCFAKELNSIIQNISTGDLNAAQNLSKRVTCVVDEVYNCSINLLTGNPFANTNKAIDHFLAYGADAISVPPPYIRSGTRLPEEIIRIAGEALTRYGLMPTNGYLLTK